MTLEELAAQSLSVCVEYNEHKVLYQSVTEYLEDMNEHIIYGEGCTAEEIAAMAEAYYVGIQPHNCYGPFATVAALHLDVCTPNFVIQEGGIHHWFADATIGDFPIQTDGYFGLPPGPGLGVAMNEEWLAAHPWDDNARPWAHRLGSNPSRQGVNWS